MPRKSRFLPNVCKGESRTEIRKKTFKTISFFLSIVLLAGSLSFLTVQPVFAVSGLVKLKTMAELILTLTAGAGTAVTNPTIVTPIISEYGATGYNMESLLSEGSFELVNKSTGESAGYTIQESIDHIGDSEWLDENNVTYKMNYDTFHSKVDISNTLAKDGARLIHEATLYNDSLNPFDWDWGGLIENFMNKGQLTNELWFTNYQTGENFVTDFQDILGNIVSFWSPNINSGIGIENNLSNISLSAGNNIAILKYPNLGSQFITVYGDGATAIINHTSSTARNFQIANLTQNPVAYTRYSINRNGEITNTVNGNISGYSVNNGNTSGGTYSVNSATTSTVFETEGFIDLYGSANSFLNNWRLNNINPNEAKYSPDLINPQFSNISAENLQNLSPSVETGKAIYPIDQNDYINFMNEANQNTEDGNTEDNAPLLEEFLLPYIDNVPQAPDDNPWEDDIEAPVSPNKPFNPSQPSLPEAPELTQEQIDASLAGTTPDLTGIFPFCIPWDIYAIFEEFRAGRKAPYIEWTLESDLFGFSYTFELDMSIFDDVAALLRLLELIAFIIGLAVATRKLIGAGG